MELALVNGQRTAAQKGLRGVCIHCQSEMGAYCGSVKIWHWKHKSKKSCDHWWEPETQWHRMWKSYFPEGWREIDHIDANIQEKHIADVKTDKGFVLEFQHSAIKPEERQSREGFYKNMAWVVDCTRYKKAYKRLCKGIKELQRTSAKGLFYLHYPADYFPPNWTTSSSLVYFDFQGMLSVDEIEKNQSFLWCLFPVRVGPSSVVGKVPRKKFIEIASTEPHLLYVKEGINGLILSREQWLGELKAKEAMRAQTSPPRFLRGRHPMRGIKFRRL